MSNEANSKNTFVVDEEADDNVSNTYIDGHRNEVSHLLFGWHGCI